jgi:hypothetical protein
VNIAGLVGAICVYAGLPCVVNNEAALRYTIPFLLAMVPYSVLIGASLDWSSGGGLRPISQRLLTGVVIAAQVILIVIFARYAHDRSLRLVTHHSVISFPFSDKFVALEAQELSEQRRGYIREIQARTPVGSRIWAWVDAPSNMDFARNVVWTFHNEWSVAPWRPNANTPADLREQLTTCGVDYILWQYQSALVPPPSALHALLSVPQWTEYRTIYQNTLKLLLALQGLATPFDVLYNDGTVVFRSDQDFRVNPIGCCRCCPGERSL